jgi:hypothetical protein
MLEYGCFQHISFPNLLHRNKNLFYYIHYYYKEMKNGTEW